MGDTNNLTGNGGTKSKGRKRSQKDVDIKPVKQELIDESVPKRKKRDRFKGMSEEEVLKRVLPDLLVPDLDICIVGINPGLTAAFVGHHYAGPGNHFWKCLFLSGLIPEQLNAYHDERLKDFGIGFTNIVERTTRGSADLKKKEIAEGAEILKKKIQTYKPKIAVFNGKGIYEVFCGHKNFSFGKQPDHFPECPGTFVYVMPSSSARCSQLPRAVDKVPFYLGLKMLRDHIRAGTLADMDESLVTFEGIELKTAVKKEKKPPCSSAGSSQSTASSPPSVPQSGVPTSSCMYPGNNGTLDPRFNPVVKLEPMSWGEGQCQGQASFPMYPGNNQGFPATFQNSNSYPGTGYPSFPGGVPVKQEAPDGNYGNMPPYPGNMMPGMQQNNPGYSYPNNYWNGQQPS